MTADEHRAALLKDLREVCEGTMKRLEGLRPEHDKYIRILDALEVVTPDRDFKNRGVSPAGHSRQPFGVWLLEIMSGLGGHKIR